MQKKKIDNRIVKDMALSAFTTWMIVHSFIGKSNDDSYAKNIREKKDGFDITKFFGEAAESIDDYFSGLFSSISSDAATDNSGNLYSGPRIKKPIMDIRNYTIDEIVELTGPSLYNRLTRSKTIKKRFHKMFPIIHTQYQGLKPTGPVTLDLVVALPRGESAYDHLATSPTGAKSLFQTLQSTFDDYFPQFTHLPYSKRDALAYVPQNNAFGGISHLMFLDKFHKDNDPYYKKASKKTQQYRMIISYNAGHGRFQKAGFIVDRIPEPYRSEAKGLANYILGLMYGNDYAENNRNTKTNETNFKF